MQKMFNIYEKEGEDILEDQRVRLLFKKVQHKDLETAKSALQAQQTMGNALTYLTCANHLSARVSELPEYLIKNRNVSGVGTREGGGGGNGGGGDSVGIYNTDGSIRTGQISNWKSLSEEEVKLVKIARFRYKKQNSTNSGDGKGGHSNSNTMRQLKSQNSKYKRQIKALKQSASNDDSKERDEEKEEELDAGDQFGGKNARRKTKKVGFGN